MFLNSPFIPTNVEPSLRFRLEKNESNIKLPLVAAFSMLTKICLKLDI